MALWNNPRWFDDKKRQEQLDDHIRATGKARFGIREFEENKKADAVRVHFDRVAPKYDFMNSLLSFGIQHAWKRAAVRMLGINPGDRVLDVCGGTGDLAILAARRTGPAGQVTIYDINYAMIRAGRHKIDPFPSRSHISYVQGDAEHISFPDNTFDCAMVGFGIRNLTHLRQGFSEMVRTLKPGGRFLCLEFSQPTNPCSAASMIFTRSTSCRPWASCWPARPNPTPACPKPSACSPCPTNWRPCWRMSGCGG
jgi:demethylmenaquinone methyltransferase/2-methoxy-6-polyprenyl-1,4-benzoquinol methylase